MITLFPTDILESIFDHLDLDALTCLWYTGSKSLQSRIATLFHHITKHRSDLTPISSLLTLLPSLQGLKSLLINVNNPTIQDSELKNLVSYLSPELKHLKIEVRDSLKWLTYDSSAGELRTAAEIRALLPKLETLSVQLENEIWGAEQFEALQALPLTSLQLLLSPVPLSTIDLLPRSLTQLDISIQPTSTESQWSTLQLPESLTDLTIDKPIESLLIPRLPRGLVRLEIVSTHPDGVMWDEATSAAMCEQLPQSLVELLWCHNGYPTRSVCLWTFDSASKLPRGLKHFATRAVNFLPEAMKALPPTLETCLITTAPMTPPFYTSAWPRSLTEVELSCIPPEEWQGLPPHITKIPTIFRNDLEAPASLAANLPTHLHYLDVYSDVNIEFLEKAGCVHVNTICIRAPFDERHLAALTRFPSLQRLVLSISHLKLLSNLAPAKLHSVFLTLNNVALSDLDLTQPWASQLADITISQAKNDLICLDETWVKNLPRSLRKMSMKIADFPRDALRYLPPQLESMQISCTQLTLVSDFEMMPRTLHEIRLFKSAAEVSGTVRQLAAALPLRITTLSIKGAKFVFSDLPAQDAWELFRPLTLAHPCLDTLELPGTHPKAGGGTFRFKVSLLEVLPPLKSKAEESEEVEDGEE